MITLTMRNIDKRSEEVLSSLISSFIDSGRPVGSKMLADRMEKKFSSATVRNVMSGLEKIGFLTHRHTSGGRVPTDKGMRYYVDSLLKIEPLSDQKMFGIRENYKDTSYTFSNVFKKTSEILSGLSNYAGLVVAPSMNEIVIKHMEFISLSKDKILGIFVGRDGSVENRIIKSDEIMRYSDLEKVNNYCNRAFYGLTLSEARQKIINEMREAQKEYDRLIKRALLLSKDMLSDIKNSELFVDGGSQLISSPDFADLDKAASLMDAFEEKRQLADFLNKTIDSEKVNIFIGSESGYDVISDCSVVAAPYKKNYKVLGSLGIIGPMRMKYSEVIPIVNFTAKLISNFLDGENIYDS